MITNEPVGQIRQERDGSYSVTLQRTFNVPPSRLWTALTEPGELKLWFMHSTVQPRTGGSVRFDSRGEGAANGTIKEWQPYTTLEYTWTWESDPSTTVRWQIGPEQNGAEVLVKHSELKIDSAIAYGAGWHDYLSHLRALLDDGLEFDRWQTSYDELLVRYDALT